MAELPALSSSMTFDTAARAVLSHLRSHVPMGFWSVTRLENGRQTYLYLDDDNAYDAAAGDSHAWEGSLCVRMLAGDGPRVAPDVGKVPAYRRAPVSRSLTIGSYAAVPIVESGGAVFGTICGLNREPRGDEMLSVQPLLELLACLLEMVLAADRQRDAALRLASAHELAAETDPLTGLLNRRGWERVVARERERFERLADPTVVVMLDLDHLKEVNDGHGHAAGDAYLASAATALRRAVRASDALARLGGDEFGVLMTGCTEQHATARVERVSQELREAGVAGSVGWAPISVLAGFPAALAAADQAMYAAKRRRRQG